MPNPRSKLLETKKSKDGKKQIKLYSCPKYEIKSGLDERNCKTILVVGETGSGKTTMLNAMLNYCENT